MKNFLAKLRFSGNLVPWFQYFLQLCTLNWVTFLGHLVKPLSMKFVHIGLTHEIPLLTFSPK